MNPTLNDVVSYYQDRLILQYRGQPKASQTIAAFVKQAVCDYVTQAVQNGYDLYTAIGTQLDILGKYIGVSRNLATPNPNPQTFGFERYSLIGGNPNGLQRYAGGINTGVIWMRYGYATSNLVALNDDQYRIVLQLKIILNSNDGTLYSIQNYLNTFFPKTITLTDNADMTLTYSISSALVSIVPISVLEQFLPKPMGVSITYVPVGAIDRTLADGTTLRTLSDGSTDRIIAL